MNLPQRHSNNAIDIQPRLEELRQRSERVLSGLLPEESADSNFLHKAMRYATLDGGKRFRPILVYATGEALELDKSQLDRIAAAIEIIHAYSLIHDDLPAMDDDELRRGRPSAHMAFDEATAILAGDALQALAFEVLATDSAIEAQDRLKVVTALAQACGSMGMAGGQALDLNAVGKTLNQQELETMHALKTGKLILLSVIAPAMVARSDDSQFAALTDYGECIGLAFQIHDDNLDVTGEPESMGKPTQADSQKNKPTFPAIIGLEASQQRAEMLRDQALASLKACPGDTTLLSWLADYVIRRDR
ncbi:MAG TPA: farnesyl diphosphate synthase [Xanthomonadales bacterium]|nr:farnesyl diphosphate synthase [Xanthomonadales bacterium]